MGADNPLLGETTCGSLLQELQLIWDEVGESDEERDRMLLQLERECLDVYKRKVDQAAKSRAQLLQSLADSRAELIRLFSALGDESLSAISIPDKSSGTIKEQLAAIAPVLDELCQQKMERIRDFTEVQLQIQNIQSEIAGALNAAKLEIDEADLSLNKLDQYQSHLKELQKEKSDRLRKVHGLVSTVHDLCAVLGMDFISTISEVHPSLNNSAGAHSRSISNETLAKLSALVGSLNEDKKKRLLKLQELASQLTDLWNLMDTAMEEKSLFDHVSCIISASVDDVSNPGSLALDVLEQAEMEVERLDQLKASKMREIAFKKQRELEEIYARAHVKVDTSEARDGILSIIDSGDFDPSQLLQEMERQIAKAKMEASSRREILEKVDKWMAACEEESWLEDYNQDQNRYNGSRGAHLNLKRAEKARILVNKIPGLVDTLVAKTKAWELERETSFTYDGVPVLAMLEEYTLLRHDREEEKKRLRDQKKFHDQIATEQEALFGSKPSPARPLGPKKVVGPRANGGVTNGSTPIRRLSMHQNGARSVSRDGRRDLGRPIAPVNYVAIAKEDVASQVSTNNPAGPGSP